MGLPETKYGINSPTDERENITRSEIKGVFSSLLSSGGVITHDGQIIMIGLEDLRDIAVFTVRQRDTLIRTRTLKLGAGDMRPLLPEGKTIKKHTSHIILPHTNKRLGYRMGRNGAIRLSIKGVDGNGHAQNYDIGGYWQLGYAFLHYAASALNSEGFNAPSIRYSDEILKDIAKTEGIGELPPRKYGLTEISNS